MHLFSIRWFFLGFHIDEDTNPAGNPNQSPLSKICLWYQEFYSQETHGYVAK